MLEKRKLVHLIDDDELARLSLAFLLTTAGYSPKLWATPASFLKRAEKTGPACVLVGARKPPGDGFDLLHEMRRRGFAFPVIVLSGEGDVAMAVKAMQAGAIDFLTKPPDRRHLIEAVDNAFASSADHEELLYRAQWAQTRLDRLTDREREVLDGLACGYPNKTIAYDLGISMRTVEVHRASAMEKLEVTSFAEALRIAFTAGMGSERRWLETHALVQPRRGA